MEIVIPQQELKSFPKIYHVGHKEIPNLFDGEVEITEKVDGSQIGFGYVKDKFIIRSKGRVFTEPDKLFRPVYECVTLADSEVHLNKAYHYYGETLATPSHNTLKYERVPKAHVALFGIFDGTNWLSWDKIKIEADRLGFDVVPRLYQGVVENYEQLQSLLEKDSFLGGEKIEGFVVKNFNQRSLLPYSPECFGKFVREGFKERNGAKWTADRKATGVEGLVAELASEARWLKALQHLRDDGRLTTSPSDIGPLIAECQKDIEVEEGTYIKDRLYSIFKKSIYSGAIKGLPEWYKQKLVEGAF